MKMGIKPRLKKVFVRYMAMVEGGSMVGRRKGETVRNLRYQTSKRKNM